jgi:hypothetical protein
LRRIREATEGQKDEHGYDDCAAIDAHIGAI